MISAETYVEADQSLRLKRIDDGHDFLCGSIQAEGVQILILSTIKSPYFNVFNFKTCRTVDRDSHYKDLGI